MKANGFDSWLRPMPEGLFCIPGGFFIDPHQAVERAIITHGHSDHAHPGHRHVLCTRETGDIMKIRLREEAGGAVQNLAYGQVLRIGDVTVRLHPAGHILGSAQVAIEYGGQRAVVSGDYKRQADATCVPFELVPCDLFITEATFGLPVFTHGDDTSEVAKLLASRAQFPERAHLIGVYALGKCQRLISLLRAQGYDRPVYLHGAMAAITDYYIGQGIELGALRPVGDARGLAGEIILCPPSAIGDLWSRRFADPLAGVASGWMRIRGRARMRGVELPLVISDHVDWPDLFTTITQTGAHTIWVTHGREEAVVHECAKLGLAAKALSLVGMEDDEG